MQKTLLAVAALAVCASFTEAAQERKFYTKPAVHHLVHKFPHHNSTEPVRHHPRRRTGPKKPIKVEALEDAEEAFLPFKPVRPTPIFFEADEEVEELQQFIPITRKMGDQLKQTHGSLVLRDYVAFESEEELDSLLAQLEPHELVVLNEVLEDIQDGEQVDWYKVVDLGIRAVDTIIKVVEGFTKRR